MLEALRESFQESFENLSGNHSWYLSWYHSALSMPAVWNAGGLGRRRIRRPGNLRDSRALGFPKASWISRPQALPRTQLPPGAGCLRSRRQEPEVSETANLGAGISKASTGNRESQKLPTRHRKPQKLPPGTGSLRNHQPGTGSLRSCSRGRPSSCSSGVNPKVRRGRRSRG